MPNAANATPVKGGRAERFSKGSQSSSLSAQASSTDEGSEPAAPSPVPSPIITQPTRAAHPNAAMLGRAIGLLSEKRLRDTLRKLCDASLEASELASCLLLGEEKSLKRKFGQEGWGNGDVCVRYEVCEQCNQEFNVFNNWETDGGRGACRWHPGELECDYSSEVWDDWDEDCHGRLDDQGEEFPEGFIWTCCHKIGTEEPCERGKHSVEEGEDCLNAVN